ncbi:MAG: PEP/pyruvate-binding domain-containing protein, partial [Thermoguttaceae bacterium]
MPDGPLILRLFECDDPAFCGGKAINLSRMIRAGLPVPDGFVISTVAHHHAQQNGGQLPDALAAEIAAAYRDLGSPPVAVRSSATAEDLADASMAGQYETLLGVSGEQELIEAVKRCWQSAGSDRLQSYLAEQGIDAASVEMAVVVQRLVPAEVAGVLFTANPRTGARDEMLIEAAWGLGEAVVSGAVQPDVVVLDRETGEEKSYTIADKAVWIEPGLGKEQGESQLGLPTAATVARPWEIRCPPSGDGGHISGGRLCCAAKQSPVDEPRRKIRCLRPRSTRDLWQLGRRAAEHFGGEQDIEWAICDDRPVLLQSRAITTLDDADAYHRRIAATGEQLRQQRREGRGPWVQHNIAETLPHPSPLTWSVIACFMSGSGGFGSLYRKVGFEPSERVCRDGFLVRIAGRIYSDTSLAPEMFFDGFPFRYDTDLLRCRPDAAQQPPTIPAGTWREQARAAKRLGAIAQTMEELAADCDRRLEEEVLPELTAWVREEKRHDLSSLSAEQWCESWQQRESRIMDRLAPEVLLPSMIAAMGIERLRAFVNEHFWDENPADLLNVLAVGEREDSTVKGNEALRAVGLGQSSCE